MLEHSASDRHKEIVTVWEEFLRMQENNTSVAQMLNVNYAKHIQENHHYLTAILKSVLLYCRQGIAFREHREDLANTKLNHGDVLAISRLVSEYDKIVSSRLLDLDSMGSKNLSNAKYTSHSIQNELISTAADIILESISAEVWTAKYFSFCAMSAITAPRLNRIISCFALSLKTAVSLSPSSGFCL